MVTKAALITRATMRKSQMLSQDQLLSSAGAEKHRVRVRMSQARAGGRITQGALYPNILLVPCSKDWGAPQVLEAGPAACH